MVPDETAQTEERYEQVADAQLLVDLTTALSHLVKVTRTQSARNAVADTADIVARRIYARERKLAGMPPLPPEVASL